MPIPPFRRPFVRARFPDEELHTQSVSHVIRAHATFVRGSAPGGDPGDRGVGGSPDCVLKDTRIYIRARAPLIILLAVDSGAKDRHLASAAPLSLLSHYHCKRHFHCHCHIYDENDMMMMLRITVIVIIHTYICV